MNKRILAFICMLALLVGLLPVGALAQTESTPDTYMVGYAKKDINPWVDPEDHSLGVLPVLLTGNGNDSERACTGMMDDNGDGKTDENDGLFTTCTAITDAKGTTVLYITLDTLQGETTAVSDIRNRIIKDLKDEDGNPVVNGNQIMISGSHTHSAPNLLNVKQNYKDSYYEYILTQVLAAAREAYNDRAAATMKRGSIDAKTATKALYPESGEGYQMNFLRHYQITAYYEKWGLLTGWVRDTKSYVVGSSFSTGGTTVGKAAALNGYEVTEAKHVAEADNTMHLLQFEFKEDKDPIVMVNWRAHPTTNSGDYPTLVSSDYVNALRYQLSKKGYRGAFFQGAGANTIISSRYDTDWTEKCPTPGTAETNTYGEMLAAIADSCLQSMTDNLPCGDIRIIQRTFTGELQTPSEGLLEIANSVTATTKYPYTATAKCDGVSYTLNSYFHAEQVIARNKQKNNQDFVTQEIAVVSLGNSAAFVTAPNELSDRYGISSYSDTNNDWTKLNDENTYGTPFVVTHANGMKGYLPNSLNYNYNTGVKDRLGNALPLGAGSYEANTSHYASGTGEKLITAFDEMLAELDQPEETRYCEACDDDVVWKPVSYLQDNDQYLGSGHYYYAAAPMSSAQRNIRTGEKLCLDLNGYTVTTKGRSYSVGVGGVLNIFDSKGTGAIVSTTASGSNYLYGTFQVKGEMNIYGGSFQFDDEGTPSVDMGGVCGITDGGTLNMYGGVIIGTNLSNVGRFADSGKGAAILVYDGQLHISNNAKVISGTLPEEGGAGPCIALRNLASNQVCLSGNASVDDIYFDTRNYTNLTISETFTGNVGLSYAPDVTLSTGMTIGNVADNADVSNATFRLPETVKDWLVYIDGSNLKIKGYKTSTVAVIDSVEYASLQDAVADSTANSVIKLIKDETAATTIRKNAYLDLNGCDVTGAVTVADGYTLTCRDSATEDYDISDGVYGTIAKVEGDGNVEGMVVDSKPALDRHVKLVDENGISFHRLTLTMNISLRAVHKGVCAPSMYYKCNVKGDEMITAAIDYYGVALSTQAMPDETNLETKCKYSRLDDPLSAGAAGTGITSTLLYGIMKPTNSVQINNRNASIPVYGKAYIQIGEDYIFADKGYTRTLKQVTQATDVYWGSLSSSQKDSIIQMYNTYSPIMSGWTMDNFLEGMDPAGDNTLKVLVVGNSHGLDATRLLYEVFKDQEYNEQKVVLGALYKSGCTMKEHADFMTNGSPNYDYYENDGSNADGSWTVIEDTVADTALNAHQWDIVIMQQMSNYAATASTFNKTQFKTVINYVKNHQVHTPRFGWHMVWTHPDGNEYLYSNGSNSNLLNPDPEAWLNYHVKNFPSATDPTKYDQSVMYDKMVACAKEYIENDTTFLGSDVYDFVIPSATAVQYAHDVQGMAEAEVYRDYTHLSDYSRLMVAYLWYAKITGNTVSNVGISAIPSVLHHNNSTYPAVSTGLEITSDMQENILEAVNHALQYPYQLAK